MDTYKITTSYLPWDNVDITNKIYVDTVFSGALKPLWQYTIDNLVYIGAGGNIIDSNKTIISSLTNNNGTNIPTEGAIKTYVDTNINNLMITNAKIVDGTIEIDKISDNFKNKIFFGYNYKGQYNADTNTPQLNDNDSNYILGDYFDVIVAGIRQ